MKCKYRVELENVPDLVTCEICKKEYKAIQIHVKQHGITPKEYKEMYPNSHLMCKSTVLMMSEKKILNPPKGKSRKYMLSIRPKDNQTGVSTMRKIANLDISKKEKSKYLSNYLKTDAGQDTIARRAETQHINGTSELECHFCNKKFRKGKYKIKMFKTHFCSDKCMFEFNKKRRKCPECGRWLSFIGIDCFGVNIWCCKNSECKREK